MPHDPAGLIGLIGGREKMAAKLDAMLASPPTFHVGGYGHVIHEMTEMATAHFGQYAQSNQPSFDNLYLFTAAGQPWKTEYWTRRVCEEMYNSSPTGFPGDEDNGSMASWYILSSIGLYPFCPGTPAYMFTSPLFSKITLHLPHERTFVIQAPNNNDESVYVQSRKLNNVDYPSTGMPYVDIMRGGILDLEMGPDAEVVQPGRYQFAVGTAGSATLVLQTVLPALLTAGAASKLICQGGTHNPFAPPFDFLDRCFAPQLRKMGADLELKLETPGFYPAGGGVFSAKILPTVKLKPLSLLEHGAIKSRRVHIYLANLPEEIAKREAALLVKYFAPDEILPPYLDFPNSPGPGNVIFLEKIHEHVTEIVTSFGEKGVPVETVVRHAMEAYNAHQASGAVVGEYLSDQLMIPLALAGSGEFICGHPSEHARTNGKTI